MQTFWKRVSFPETAHAMFNWGTKASQLINIGDPVLSDQTLIEEREIIASISNWMFMNVYEY